VLKLSFCEDSVLKNNVKPPILQGFSRQAPQDATVGLSLSASKRGMKRMLTLFLFIAAAAHAANETLGAAGDWKTSTGSVVRVYPCGQEVCLKIVQLAKSAPETTDQQNPDAALRHRVLCGLTIGTGFHQDDATHLSGGHLYDPKSGHTYRGTISANGDSLNLRGYIGISLFGRSETWQRVAPVVGCG
jgi:uncharacterized protein (DUF2147 family)